MPRYNDRTKMGGGKGSFQTTAWTLILDAKTSNLQRQKLIINELMAKYWKPVYCYCNRKGYDNEKAKDLTQGFFQDVVLGRRLIQQAEKNKGRFRTLLLTALDRYIIDMHKQETAGKRLPKDRLFALEDYDLPEIPQVSPEQGFNYAWLADLLDKVLSQVKQECLTTGKQAYWEIFRLRVLDPIMHNEKPVALSQITEMHGIDNQAKISNMLVTVKRRLRKALENRLKQLGQSDPQIEEEIQDLMNIFSK